MAYDEHLAERIRDLLAETHDGPAEVTEQKMFGGLAFLIGGHMAIAASGQGGVLVRCDPAQSDQVVARTRAELAVMQGRFIDGWLRVADEHLKTRRQLAAWVERGRTYAASLPPKTAKKAKTATKPNTATR